MEAESGEEEEPDRESPEEVSSAESGTGDDTRREPPNPSLDVVFDVLQNRRRRLVLSALSDPDGPTSLGDLAEHIAAIENDKPRSALDSQERKRVYVGLYQSHLPKMDEAGAIRFDDDRGTVEPGPHIDVFRGYLDRDRDEGAPVGFYATIAAAGVLGALVTAFVGDPLAPVVVGGLIVAVGVASDRASG